MYLFVIIAMFACSIVAFAFKWKKKNAFLCFSAFIFISAIILIFYLHRSFYSVGGINFTVWKTYAGCYVMPYRYWGICKPNNNYLRLSNIGAIDIYIRKDSTLMLFADPHRDGYAELDCHLKKYRYYTYITGDNKEVEISRRWTKLWEEYASKYSYLYIDARKIDVEIGEKK
jgi:hypothetical protein